MAHDSITAGTLPIGMLALLLPIHLFATFCYLYIAYFVARCIISVQQQQIVNTADYILLAVQIIFLPIGIWFLQPYLNKFESKSCLTKDV